MSDPDYSFALKIACILVCGCILGVALLRWLVPMILNAGFAGSYILGGVVGIFGLFAIVIGGFQLISLSYKTSYKG